MGALYSFTVSWPVKDCHCTEYSLTITRDRNKAYHVYQYSQHSPEVGVWEKVTMSNPSVLHSLPIWTSGTQYFKSDSTGRDLGVNSVYTYSGIKQECMPVVLHIATYNIWNVNSRPLDSYQKRLKRLKKV